MSHYECRLCGRPYVTRVDPAGDLRLGASLPTVELIRCTNPACELHDLSKQNQVLTLPDAIEVQR